MSHSIQPKGFVFVMDNSSTSIDGDLYPNRLIAQKVAIQRLSIYLFSVCHETQISLMTMSNTEFGIRSSFTSNLSKIQQTMINISSGGFLLLEKSLKTSFLLFNHLNEEINDRHVIIFIGSNHDLTDEKKINQLKAELKKRFIYLSFVILDNGINSLNLLKEISSFEFLDVSNTRNLLSDLVLASKIGTGSVKPQISLKSLKKSNPDLYLATKESLVQFKKTTDDKI
ncbi:26S proteasome regulatory subunit rpn10-related protein [Tritrichomonas foetus]|uniref:26S proteasome regulatory subunit rpn10-related protein n=1 Tax=Tritrichomonas foetus TaxID=1144522 RepID=A0A1J4JXS2_9EUKA|nr:26S proteasome regulatory subunit rpn10-related protein [Tritrichomonas foetus]|eukprot:OHT03953.1 26S proteasome regulatory subunit rpn10-related protein [Tritrichomonas foetus]